MKRNFNHPLSRRISFLLTLSAFFFTVPLSAGTGGKSASLKIQSRNNPDAVALSRTSGSISEVGEPKELDIQTAPNSLANLSPYTGSGAVNQYSFDSETKILNVKLSMGNFGSTTASNFRLGLYLSQDESVTTDDILVGSYAIGNLAGGYFANMSFTLDLQQISGIPAGTNYVSFYFDDLGQVTESNENDNTAYFTPAINIVQNEGSGGKPKIRISPQAQTIEQEDN